MNDDRTPFETAAEALAGVTITDPDFDGLEREAWRELAALKAAVRAVDAKAPEGADLLAQMLGLDESENPE